MTLQAQSVALPDAEAVGAAKLNTLLFRILSIGAACCFIGHGAFGFITKKDWVRFFEIVGFSESTAFQLMPVIGFMDVTLGLLVLVRPMAAALFFMASWAAWTALCRPLSGLPWWEFFERAGNYGVPLALVALSSWEAGKRGFFKRLQPTSTPERLIMADRILRIATALLLIGHGGFAAFMKKQMILDHWSAAGLPITEPMLITQGWAEIIGGVLILFVPSPPLVLLLFFWKVATELLYPISGDPLWEFIERGGSYTGLLALFFLHRFQMGECTIPEQNPLA